MKNKFRNLLIPCTLVFIIISCNEEQVNINMSKDIQPTVIHVYNEENDVIESIVESSQTVESQVILSENQDYFIREIQIFGHSLDRETVLSRIDTNISIEVVGWSENGLFAYRSRHHREDGRFGGWVYSFVIIDTNNNEVLKRDFIEMSSWMFFDGEYVPVTEEILGYLSGEYKTKWNAILEENNINGRIDNPFESVFQYNLLDFPIDSFYSWFEVPDIIEWKLILGNNTIQKIISENTMEEDHRWDNIYARKILGYFKSPYENKIVIAVGRYYWGAFSGGFSFAGIELFSFNMDDILNH